MKKKNGKIAKRYPCKEVQGLNCNPKIYNPT